MTRLTVLAVPAFNDNYLWLIHDGHHAAVVDPGDAEPILAALAEHDLTLVAILLTHHHADHVGGVPALLAHRRVPVFGPRLEDIAGVTDALGEGDLVHLPAIDLTLSVLDVPGHTRGHIAYLSGEQGWLFCGDTLFAGGCGRLFEGTPAQMASSLDKLSALPGSTLVFCAHEYTLSNLRFALAVEPGNLALQARFVVEQEKRTQGLATVPSYVDLERATNPFLRWRQPEIVHALQEAGKLGEQAAVDDIAVFAALRSWKNSFS